MKRKIFFLLFLSLLAFGIIFVVRILTGRTPKQGKLKITSTPIASVFLDNKHVGRTPYDEKVSAGDITIKLVPESTVTSVTSWQEKVTIAPNTLTYVNRDLTESELTSSGEVLWLEKITSKTSEVDVVTNPDGASILLDDALKGISPLNIQDVSAAEHTLTVASPGFLPKSLKIKATAGYKVKIAIQLALGTGTPDPTPTPIIVTPLVTPVSLPSPLSTPSATIKITPTKGSAPSVTPKATPTDPAKPFILIKDTPTGFLNVRKEPSTSSNPPLGQVNPGDKFTIQDSKEVSGVTWYQIKYDGTNLGWVSGTYVEKTE